MIGGRAEAARSEYSGRLRLWECRSGAERVYAVIMSPDASVQEPLREMVMTVRRLQFVICLLPGLLMAGAASAQQNHSPGGLISSVMQGLGLSPTIPPAADFVIRSRPDPAQIDYLPLRPTPPGFLESANLPLKRFEAEQDSIEALEKARETNRARAAGIGTPDVPTR
jgi:hypothetical protein